MINSTYRTYAFFTLSAAALCLFSSCTRKVRITSNTFADKAFLTPKGFPLGSSFAIECINQENPLFAKEIAYKITEILQEKGYRVTQADRADYSLRFDYGMGVSTRRVNVPTYVPGKVHIKNGHKQGAHGPVEYQETTQSVGSTVYVPHENSLFTREVKLQVYLAQKTEYGEQIWQGKTVSCGTCNDLREMIDYLLVFAFKHFGTDTKKTIHEVKKEWFKKDNENY